MTSDELSPETAHLVPLDDAEALRDYLDALNDAGISGQAAGMDSHGDAFLVALHGCYAETEIVLYGNPWDPEVDYGTGRYCDECNGQTPHQMSSLHFPVWVVQAPTEDGVFLGFGDVRTPPERTSHDQ